MILRTRFEPMGIFEYITVLIAAYVAGGVYVWPRYLCLMAGQNGAVALGLSGVWGLLIFLGIVFWANNTPGNTVYQKLVFTVGSTTARMVITVVGIMTMGYLALVGVLYIAVLTTVVIPGHRAWTLGLVLVIYLLWLSTRPPISVVRLFTLTIPGLTVLTLITLALGIHNAQFPNALRPHWPMNWTVIGSATISGTYFWVPILPLATTVAMVRRKFRRKILRATAWTVSIQIGLLFMLYAVAVVTLGPEGVAGSTWPIVFVFENIDLSNFFISEIGLGVAIIWTVSFIGFIAWHIWHQGLLLQYMGPKCLNRHYKLAIITAVAIVGGLGLQVSLDPKQLETLLLNDLAPLNFWVTSLWVGVVMGITLWKQRVKKIDR